MVVGLWIVTMQAAFLAGRLVKFDRLTTEIDKHQNEWLDAHNRRLDTLADRIDRLEILAVVKSRREEQSP